MTWIRLPFHLFLIAVVLSWTVPYSTLAQETDTVAPVLLVLSHDEVLQGTAFQKDGSPAEGRTVVLGKNGKPIAKTLVDAEGRFQFRKVKPGDYQIATSEAAAMLKCHTKEGAPAGAVKQVVLSQKSMIARGQQPASVLLHPLLIGLVIAAAIVIPIAVSNNRDDAS